MVTIRFILDRYIYRQYDIGPWLGGLKDLLGRSMFYMTPVNLFMLSATTYHVTARDFIWQFAPWVNFWMFFGALVFAAVCAMVIEYKIVVPSSVNFMNTQGYKHGNLIKRDLEVVMQEIQKLEAKLDALNARYNGYTGENNKSTGDNN